MRPTTRRHGALTQLSWWGLFLVVVVHGVFAIAMGLSELLCVLGVSPELKHRVMSQVFTVHALAGSIALTQNPARD